MKLAHLKENFLKFGQGLHSVRLFHRSLDSTEVARDDAHRHEPSVQKKRRTMLARYRNTLLSLALKETDDFVLWIDADMKMVPESIISTFISTKKQIVTVHTKRGKLTYDLNAWSGPRTKPSWSELRRIKNGGLYIPRPG